MKAHVKRGWIAAAVISVLGASAGSVSAAPTPPPAAKTWLWPVFNIDRAAWQSSGAVTPAEARPNVWSSHCEYQEFTQDDIAGEPLQIDLHPGIDIRGEDGDLVIFPERGKLVRVSNRHHCGGDRMTEANGVQCRLWVRTEPPQGQASRLYYVGHIDVGHRPNGMITSVLRAAHAAAATAGTEDASPADLPVLERGERAGQMVPFPTTADMLPVRWDHVHVGVYDETERFDSLDPLAYLNRDYTVNGVAKKVEDDTRPTLSELTVRPRANSGTVDMGGQCGPVVTGTLDVTANINDVFRRQNVAPEAFPGDNLNRTVDIKGARFLVRRLDGGTSQSGQWFESPLGCTGLQCGLWRVQFGDRATYTSAAAFFDALTTKQRHGAPFRAGNRFGALLWDEGPTENDHTTAMPKKKVHILSNRVREDGTNGGLGWDTTTSGGDGRYVVTAEAWDFDGNISGASTLVRVNNGGSALPAGWLQLRDHDQDFGQVPSETGGEVSWLSSDIRVADPGQTPSGPRGEPLVVGQTYDVWVNVTNRGCQDRTGVQVAVYSALAGTAFTNFDNITEPPASYVGNFTVPALSSTLVGPFPWTVQLEDLGGNLQGHRCLLAAVNAAGDPGPPVTPASWNVTNDPKVAQRNVQFSQLEFFIRNPQGATQSSVLELELDGLPVEDPSRGSFELTLRAPAATWPGLRAAFAAAIDGATVTFAGDLVRIQARKQKITLPAFDMPGVTEIFSSATGTSPGNGVTYNVVLRHRLGGAQVGGMVFSFNTPEPPQ